jgi:hypothetical protein
LRMTATSITLHSWAGVGCTLTREAERGATCVTNMGGSATAEASPS